MAPVQSFAKPFPKSSTDDGHSSAILAERWRVGGWGFLALTWLLRRGRAALRVADAHAV